jgi:cation/acetate symporter
VQVWTFIIVGLTFALYIGIAIRARAGSTREFYVAGTGVPPLANGMATAADWMSAASFISMAGIISFAGYFGSVYLMGWTGGYVLLALLLAPYLRKFGKFTVPDFVGDRYYSQIARVVAVFCAVFVSFTYVAGQMRGVGVVFSRFLEVDITWGVIIGMAIVFFYAVLGGMKGITYTQVAQYCVLIFAFMVPAIAISITLTGNPVPQIGFGSEVKGESVALLEKLNGLHQDLGFARYTAVPESFMEHAPGRKSGLDVFMITAALMLGTAGLPHVIIRFYTVPRVRDARISAGWALLFIAILYTSAPAVGAFARTNLITTTRNAFYSSELAAQAGEEAVPQWFEKWERTGLLAWVDKNGDNRIQYSAHEPALADGTKGAVDLKARNPVLDEAGEFLRGPSGEIRYAAWANLSPEQQAELARPRVNDDGTSIAANELYIDRDIMVLANPEIANLPKPVIALVAAGGLAAALSTAAGLLLVVSTSISHDLLKRWLMPGISERGELVAARVAAGVAVCVAGYLGINPPGFVAEVVAFAFGLAASSFFPAIILGIFSKRVNREGAISGMVLGIAFTAGYIIHFKFINPAANTPANWFLGISPEGIGTIGMLVNMVVTLGVSAITPPPPQEIQDFIEEIRVPRGAGEAHAH